METRLSDSGLDKEALRRVREHTEWSISNCAALLREHGTDEAAIKFYDLIRDNFNQWHTHCENTLAKVLRDDSWLSDFLCQETQYLCIVG